MGWVKKLPTTVELRLVLVLLVLLFDLEGPFSTFYLSFAVSTFEAFDCLVKGTMLSEKPWDTFLERLLFFVELWERLRVFGELY